MATVLEFLEDLFYWLDDQAKRWGNQLFGPKLDPKIPKLSKIHISRNTGTRKLVENSKWPQDMIYNGWSKICVPLKQSEVPQKYSLLYFGAL